MDEKRIRYYFDNLKDKSCDYSEVNNLYILSTIKDIAENCDVKLSDDEFFKLFKVVKGKVFISDIDSKIERIIKENTDWLD